MPYKTPIVCLKCEATESPLWTNAENLGVICLNCVNEAKKDVDDDTEVKVSNQLTTNSAQHYNMKFTIISRKKMKKNQLKRKREQPDHIKPDTIQMQQPNATQKDGEEGVYLRKFL